jgi:hypothetical protein
MRNTGVSMHAVYFVGQNVIFDASLFKVCVMKILFSLQGS